MNQINDAVQNKSWIYVPLSKHPVYTSIWAIYVNLPRKPISHFVTVELLKMLYLTKFYYQSSFGGLCIFKVNKILLGLEIDAQCLMQTFVRLIFTLCPSTIQPSSQSNAILNLS